MIELLPEEVLLNVVDYLSEDRIEKILSTLPLVCRSGSKAFGAEKIRFWNGLGERYGIPVHLSNRRRRQRSAANVKRNFFLRKQQIDEARRLQTDKIVWQIWKRLRKSDCVAWVEKRLQSIDRSSTKPNNCNIICRHRVRGLENRTLLMLACWWGRHRTVRWLLEQDDELGPSSNVFYVDDGNASALLIASWAGHIAVVKLLLERLEIVSQSDRNIITQHLNLEGIPPLTSSCGGRGPKTAICWAERKGFRNVVRVLEEAGASTGHRNG